MEHRNDPIPEDIQEQMEKSLVSSELYHKLVNLAFWLAILIMGGIAIQVLYRLFSTP